MLTRKFFALLGSAIFLCIAPGFVVGLVPWWITRWQIEPSFLKTPLLRFVGGTLVALGLLGLLDSFVRFAWQGLGTPAPVFPTRQLIVTGLYRYVRNPMYVAVVMAILGQSLVFGSVRLLGYTALVWLAVHAFVLAYEEPKLRATFGSQYERFCQEVPRWIPRLTPWKAKE